MHDKIVAVGAGVAGITAVETLRRQGFAGRLVLVGGEPGPPIDRPPLSKQVLTGAWALERAALREAGHLAALDVTVRHDTATGLDAYARQVHLAHGEPLSYDGLIIASGAAPRRLPFGHDLSGVHVLRDAADSTGLHRSMHAADRVVIIGAGFLGSEVAAVTAALGRHVSLVDPVALPLLTPLGATVAQRIATLHRQNGVHLRTGVTVTGFRSDTGHVTGVRLSDGTELDATCVLVAIGARPATGWLDSSGLRLDDGVVCDAFCKTAAGVYAAGDVARWYNPRYGRLMRVEHRTNAAEQGIAAATNLLRGDTTPFAALPYFWSDQYDIKIQAYGVLGADADVDLDDLGDGRFVARYSRDGRLTGVLGWNAVKALRPYRAELLQNGEIHGTAAVPVSPAQRTGAAAAVGTAAR
ncbi:NAD(P)/FAD-dependent oxidoreductase [Dactylosporangium sp. CA-233914]|uniref:NAD(P)/FAD-dependent oxidoreductase n=1 Tax=Dactylosporangium sp. CA-233914 TaxID=3239934 RepID=UPI003D8E4474